MVVPALGDMTLPYLRVLGDGKERSTDEMHEELGSVLGLSDEDKNMRNAGGQKRFPNTVSWAKFDLKKAGLIKTARKTSVITQKGLEILKDPPPKIDRAYLGSLEQGGPQGNGTSQDGDMVPDERMGSGYLESRGRLESEMLEKIKGNTPDFFEELVVKLITEMGYGDGKKVGRVGDGGIDGVIKEDKLGLGQIHLQAKRWDSTVPLNEVQAFAGALSSKKSSRGVFITTSDFSRDAREFASIPSNNIIIINGRELVRLLFDHNVGFKTIDTYYLKEIDEGFFPE